MIALYIIAAIIILFGLFYKFVFLRDNKNLIPEGEYIVSPASGKVINIQVVDGQSDIRIAKGLFGKIFTDVAAAEPYYLVSIFMSPLDVHINKMPISGKVVSIEHSKGKFKAANSFESSLVNEKTEYILETKIGLVKVIQIAGFLARRTRSLVQTGQELTTGQKLGIILLGSQTVLLFPKKNFNLEVKVGGKVSSGETIIAKI